MKKICLKALLLCCGFLLFNCQNDDPVAESKQDHFEISIERKNFKEFHDLPDLVSKHIGEGRTDNAARGGHTDPLYDFEIDSTSVTQIIKEEKTYYTMAIYRAESIDNSFENLVISNDGGENTAHIIKYFPSQEYLQSLETNVHVPFIGEINITPLDYNQLTGRGQLSCYTVTMAYCGNGPAGTLAGPGCYNHSDGGAHVFTRTYTVCKELPADNTYISPDVPQSGGGGGSASPSTPIVTEPILLFAEFQFVNGLSAEQKAWWNNPLNSHEKQTILDYLNRNPNEKEFGKELVALSSIEVNQQDVYELINLTVLIEKSDNNLFTEEFASTLIPYLGFNVAHLPPDYPLSSLTIKTFLDYRKLRQLNPEWSRAKCIWNASREIVHLSLDVFGLIPVAGEIADLTNGVLYTIEGDGLNATLSYSSAIPIVGWATASAKFAIKIKNVSQTAYTVSTKVKLVWKNVGGNILFGSRNQLRKVLGMGSVAVDARQAHHIIPWGKLGHPAVQKAAKSGSAFHMNEAVNGLSLSTTVHSGSHGHYDSLVQGYLDAIPVNATPDFCYNKIMEIISKVKVAVQNNPGVPINQLNF